MTYHLTTISVAKTKRWARVQEDREKSNPSCTAGGITKNGAAALENCLGAAPYSVTHSYHMMQKSHAQIYRSSSIYNGVMSG